LFSGQEREKGMAGLLRSFPCIPSGGKGIKKKRLHPRAVQRNPLGRGAGTHVGPCFATASFPALQ